jgi:Zn-dependent metalloprotease
MLSPRNIIALIIAGGSLFAAPHEDRTDRYAQRSVQKIHESRNEMGLDERHTFRIQRTHHDELGQAHTRLQQYYDGVKIWGGEVIAHQDKNGDFLPATYEHKKHLFINTCPSLDASSVLGIVNADLHPKGPYAFEPSVEMVIYPEMSRIRKSGYFRKAETELNATDLEHEVRRYHLAYYVRAALMNPEILELGQWDYIIDAHSGEIIKKWNSLTTSDSRGIGKTQYSGDVILFTNSINGGYELLDMTRGVGGNYTTNMFQRGSIASGSPTYIGSIYTDSDNTWGDNQNYDEISSTLSDNGQTAAADAHYAMQVTWDLFKNVYGRNGIDGFGRAIFSRVHFANGWDNAFWLDSCFCMSYGDGTKVTTLTALDLSAHEMSHGMCANSAKLIYDGESGALNEANSDIFGALAEIYQRAGATGSSLPSSVANTDPAWTFGEQLYSRPLRWMYKPSKDGQSPDQWSSSLSSVDVHYSSGPANRMFFFLSQGASSNSTSDNFSDKTPNGFAGIGPDKAGRIWYRALTTYMTADTDFAAARNACINAATDLYGVNSREVAAVKNAYAAINVGLPAPGVTVAISPSATTMYSNVYQLFKATVTNAGNTSVTWTCTGGSISTSGNFKAPWVSTTRTYKVRATSVADTTKYAEATVTVNPSATITTSEVESNGSTSTANVVPDASTKITGAMSSTSDLDFFKINVAAGRTVTVNMTGPSGSDYDLYLLNSAGSVLKRSEGSTCTESVTYQNSGNTTAVYYIKVTRDSGSSSTNAYNLVLLR